jgi:RNA polymerase sigma-70 factor (ECF subfamily)
MREVLQLARAVWPDIELAPEVFAAYVAERIPDGLDLRAAQCEQRASDLYLACACAHGDARALQAFDRHCLSVLDDALPRMSGVDSDIVDEVKQRLRRKLFLADTGPARIREFSGRGDLRRWVRVIGVREALTLIRRSRRGTGDDDSLVESSILRTADPELEYLKRRYQREFTLAFGDAMRKLTARERALLRQSCVDGLTIDELGALHRVHRATAARWLARAQANLSQEVLATLARTLRLQPSELDSILRLIRSGLDLSLETMFAPRRLTGRARMADAQR